MHIFRNLLVISLFVFWGSTNNTLNKNLYFDVVHNGKVIGSLNATKTLKDSITYYQSSTTIETRIIKEIRVHYKYDVAFENNMLESSKVDITVNEKPHAKTQTLRNDSDYQIIKNDEDNEILTDSINYTTVQLYFKEPKNIKKCFSEQDGSFNTIMALGNHSYKKINSKGRENIYYYNKGILKKATIDSGLIKFEIIAKN
ncbi:DUF6134 family protein [uncultured Winogradskyella sp.]|uniref:DUF6134 family protein n=1 Tax=uncultured Winogradskyella sp. TaxID=395353 RepID=UPI00261373B0|nr:DUF6134 family protein [uncultured Winogradskyella sp.]